MGWRRMPFSRGGVIFGILRGLMGVVGRNIWRVYPRRSLWHDMDYVVKKGTMLESRALLYHVSHVSSIQRHMST